MPLDGLLEAGCAITLVDIVHPISVRLRARREGGRVRLAAGDLSGALGPALEGRIEVGRPALADALSDHDLVVSLNLLSQLPLAPVRLWRRAGHDEGAVAAGAARIVRGHLDLLGQAPRALLVADVARRGAPDGVWSDLLHGIDPGPAEAEWSWAVAPPGELAEGIDERRVIARALGLASAGPR